MRSVSKELGDDRGIRHLHSLQRIWSAAHILVAKDKAEEKVKEDLWLILSGDIGIYTGGLRRSVYRQGMRKAGLRAMEKIIQLRCEQVSEAVRRISCQGVPVCDGLHRRYKSSCDERSDGKELDALERKECTIETEHAMYRDQRSLGCHHRTTSSMQSSQVRSIEK